MGAMLTRRETMHATTEAETTGAALAPTAVAAYLSAGLQAERTFGLTVKSPTGAHRSYRCATVKANGLRSFPMAIVYALGEGAAWYLVGAVWWPSWTSTGLQSPRFRLGEAAGDAMESSPWKSTDPTARGLVWLLTHLDALGQVQVFHDGRCSRCGRDLTHPESISTGLGPICAAKG